MDLSLNTGSAHWEKELPSMETTGRGHLPLARGAPKGRSEGEEGLGSCHPAAAWGGPLGAEPASEEAERRSWVLLSTNPRSNRLGPNCHRP